MDTISAVASVIALYQLASEVPKICFNYTQGFRRADQYAERLLNEMSWFEKSLLNLKGLLDDESKGQGRNDRPIYLDGILRGEDPLFRKCSTDIQRFKDQLDKMQGAHAVKAIIHKMCWLFKKEESATLIDTLRSLVHAIDRALNLDSNVTIRAMDSTTKEIKDALDRQEQEARLWKQQDEWTKAEKTRANILRWLSHPDPSENHNTFEHRNSRASTGRWFLDGPLFQQLSKIS